MNEVGASSAASVEECRGRLAPSPTGAQHLGNARTYLIAWLAVRSVGGKIILRIEDIDSPRVKSGADHQAIEDLRWLGIDWDEGPDRGGPNAPYVQTQRAARYAETLQKLLDQGRIYPCTCSRSDVAAAASAPHAGQEGPVYPGFCRTWHPGDRLPEAGSFAWRFRCEDRVDTLNDLVRGPVTCDLMNELGDFPITRKGGDAAYQLAVVVDDAAMSINQIVRGDDLLPSAFRQRMLQRALGLTFIDQAHVPLVVGPDGRRLAKRHGDTRLSYYRDRNVKPERIIGLLAWSIGLTTTLEPVSANELVSRFSFQKLTHQPFVVLSEHEAWLTRKS